LISIEQVKINITLRLQKERKREREKERKREREKERKREREKERKREREKERKRERFISRHCRACQSLIHLCGFDAVTFPRRQQHLRLIVRFGLTAANAHFVRTSSVHA